MAGIYIHIPFCIKKCYYCDFYSIKINPYLKDTYIEALCKEISRYEYKDVIKSIYFGGGTPSILEIKDIDKILNLIYKKFSICDEVEITIEANPETLNEEKIFQIKKSGINRISIGIQSLNPFELKILGRVHNEKIAELILAKIANNFKNFSVDIIYGIPYQSINSLNETLKKVLNYSPPHISAYELMIEEKTPFYKMIKNGILQLPQEDLIEDMYWLIVNTLEDSGYTHYEISNYAKKGFQCIHNLNYWLRGEYLGFGVSAHSFVKETRYRNIFDIKKYIKLIESFNEIVIERINIDEKEKKEEEIMLNLRTKVGLDIKRYSIKEDIVKELVKEKLIDIIDEKIVLTNKGMLLSNSIITKFIM